MAQPGGWDGGPGTPQGGWVPQQGSPSWAGGASSRPRPQPKRRRRTRWPLAVFVIVLLAGGAFVIVRDRDEGGSAPPPDARAARARLVASDASCRPPQKVPDDVFGGTIDAPDLMVECTIDDEPVRIVSWGTTARRAAAMPEMAAIFCRLDDDADPAIVTGPMMISTFGGDSTNPPERAALDHTADLLDAPVTDDLCAEG